jgi:hypothetical protein
VNPRGWQAFHRDEFVSGRSRLFLYRPVGERIDINLEDGTWQTIDADVVEPANAGWVLPRGGWEAIVALIEPDASKGEIQRLEEALTIERARVDRMLDTSTGSQVRNRGT